MAMHDKNGISLCVWVFACGYVGVFVCGRWDVTSQQSNGHDSPLLAYPPYSSL